MNALRELLGARGRIGRAPYCWTSLLWVLLVVAGIMLIVETDRYDSVAVPVVVVGVWAIATWAFVLATIRRLHDVGMSGWNSVYLAIPIADLVLVLSLLAKHGDTGDNEYGPDPSGIPKDPREDGSGTSAGGSFS